MGVVLCARLGCQRNGNAALDLWHVTALMRGPDVSDHFNTYISRISPTDNAKNQLHNADWEFVLNEIQRMPYNCIM
jgi:hypothetical protein